MKKIKISLLLILSAALIACSSPQPNKVGYQELASSIRSGQSLQLITNKQKIINLKVISLSGDIIKGVSLQKPKRKILVNLNDISKVRLYE